MRIAVVADTHDQLARVPWDSLRGADEIWHLGDVCSPATLDLFRALDRPLKIVRGNCDAEYSWPPYATFVRCKLRFYLVHIPPDNPPPGVHILIHGHTHHPRDEMVGRTRFLNPGSAGVSKMGVPLSMAWLTLAEGSPPTWEVHLLR